MDREPILQKRYILLIGLLLVIPSILSLLTYEMGIKKGKSICAQQQEMIKVHDDSLRSVMDEKWNTLLDSLHIHNMNELRKRGL